MANCYLMKYKGTYRILPTLDKETNDFPRTANGEIDDTYDDLYISCQYGNKIFVWGHDTNGRVLLQAYIPSITRGRNIKKSLDGQNISYTNYFETDEEVDAPEFNSIKPIKNTNMVFLHNFGQESGLTQVQINIRKWSKKNALMKILKIVTGYTGIYDTTNLMKFDFTIDKVSDANQLRFGVTSNNCSVHLLDNDLMINTLYEKNLIYKNIQVQISVDGIIQGVFYINEKNSEKGSNEWVFDCVDRLESLKNVKKPMMAIAKRNIYEILNYVLSGVVTNVVWEKTAKEYCVSKYIEQSYFEANQNVYDLMLKCAQVGLLRIYIDRNDICKITKGV